jgi:hypothetical protein
VTWYSSSATTHSAFPLITLLIDDPGDPYASLATSLRTHS